MRTLLKDLENVDRLRLKLHRPENKSVLPPADDSFRTHGNKNAAFLCCSEELLVLSNK